MPIRISPRVLAPLVLLLWSCTAQPHQPFHEPSPEERLAAKINRILENPVLAQCTVGMNVVRLKNNRILFHSDINQDAAVRSLLKSSKIPSLYCFPLWMDENVIGLYNISECGKDRFDEQDNRLVTLVASLTGKLLKDFFETD